jgi:hypothetical protein
LGPAATSSESTAPNDPARLRRAAERLSSPAGTRLVLVGLMALAAALRFGTLGEQGFSADEAFTVHLTRISFGGMLHQLSITESTPPLHYVLVWIWGRLFGTDEIGLRSLSALCGVLTVPAAYAVATRVFSRRAGLIAAALATVSPILVWYSQEARSYALLVLLATISLYFFVSALAQPSPRLLAGWGISAALSLATHYFALFVILPEAAWLIWCTHPRRRAILACAVPGVVALALAPLAYAQRHPAGGWGAKWITPSETSLITRIARIPRELALGYAVPAGKLLAVVLGLLALYAVWRAIRGPDALVRRRTCVLLSVAAVGFAVPILAAVASPGLDLILSRFFLAAAIPVLVVLAGGFAQGRAGRMAAAVFGCVSLAMVVAVDLDQAYQRPDLRGAIRSLGPAQGSRLVIVSGEDIEAARIYLPGQTTFKKAPVERLTEVDLIAMPLPGASRPPRLAGVGPPVPGLVEVERRLSARYTVLRFRARTARLVPFRDLLPGIWPGWSFADVGRAPTIGGVLQDQRRHGAT